MRCGANCDAESVIALRGRALTGSVTTAWNLEATCENDTSDDMPVQKSSASAAHRCSIMSSGRSVKHVGTGATSSSVPALAAMDAAAMDAVRVGGW